MKAISPRIIKRRIRVKKEVETQEKESERLNTQENNITEDPRKRANLITSKDKKGV